MTAVCAIIGLGNPGLKYTETRHNAGFWFIDALASALGLSFSADRKLYGELATVQQGESRLFLFKPSTFMNQSGRAVAALARYYKLVPEQLLVAYDDLDLPDGVARLKFSGGHGGHNGLRDIEKAVNSRDFHRLRIGIGRPADSAQVVNYVLNRPGREEFERISASILKSLDVMDDYLHGDRDRAVKNLHTKD